MLQQQSFYLAYVVAFWTEKMAWVIFYLCCGCCTFLDKHICDCFLCLAMDCNKYTPTNHPFAHIHIRGHSFSTYVQRGRGLTQRGRGQAKLYAMRTMGEGAYTWKYVRKNVPFCTCFVIFSYAGRFYHTSLSLV